MKKSYSTKAYYNDIMRLLESDINAPTETPDKSNDSKFKSMVVAAGAGSIGALACIKYLDTVFDIGNIHAAGRYFSSAFSDAEKIAPRTGIFHTIFSALSNALGATLKWVATMCLKFTNKLTSFREFVGSSTTYRYGEVFAIALTGAAVGMLIYKVYQKFKNSRQKTESTSVRYLNQNILINEAIIESNKIFKRLLAEMFLDGIFVGSTKQLPDGNWQFSANDLMSKSPSGFDSWSQDKQNAWLHQRGKVMQNPELQSKLRGIVDADAMQTVPPATEGFMDKVLKFLQNMWNSAKDWCGNNPILVTTIGVCIVAIAAWFGVKKYREKKQLSMAAATAESAMRRTRKSNRRRVYA